MKTGKIEGQARGGTDVEPADFLHRNRLWLLTIILCLAFGLRLAAFFALRESIYFDYLLWDERMYFEEALDILAGNFAPSRLFAWYSALLYGIFGPDPVVVRAGNIVAGTAVCLVVYLAGYRIGGALAGLLSCLAAALYQPLILYSVVPLNTILSVLFFSLALYLLMCALRRPSWPLAAALGAVLAVLTDLRPNALILVPLVPLAVLWYGFRDRLPGRSLALFGAAFVAGLVLTATPMAAKNLAINGSLAGHSAQLGMNLHLGNNLDNPDPYYRPVPFARTEPREQEIHFIIEASRRSGNQLQAGKASSYWVRQVTDQAREHPGQFLEKMGLKALAALNRFDAGDHYDPSFLSGTVPFFGAPFLPSWLIIPLGIAGLVLTGRSRDSRASALALLTYAVTLVIFFTNMRYRTPLATMLIPFAAAGLGLFIHRVREGRYGTVIPAVLVFALLLATAFLPVRATDDRTAYDNTHAIILYSLDRVPEALSWWKASSEKKGSFSVFADLALARHYLSQRDFSRARIYLDRVDDESFAAASRFDLEGDLHILAGNLEEALAAYETSLEINSGQRLVLYKLIRILSRIDRERAGEYYRQLKYVASFYPPPADHGDRGTGP